MALRATYIRLPLYGAACLRHSSTAGGVKTETGPRARDMAPDFEDTREAYRSKSFSELLRHYAVFKLFTITPLVNNNKQVSTEYVNS